LGLRMRSLALFDRALTHASAGSGMDDRIRNYEALEFLGDAVLGLAVAHDLYERVPDRTPGEYSRMRASVVNRRCLAHVAQKLDIAPAIRLGKGEELSGGRERAALLADCLEALIGAVYVDAGWRATRQFVSRTLQGELDRVHRMDSVWDYKSRLQHYCQAERIALPVFKVVRSEGPDHRKEFEVEVVVRGRPVGKGTGRSKKEAEQEAARAALEHEDVHFD
jgi:ribonuclease III